MNVQNERDEAIHEIAALRGQPEGAHGMHSDWALVNGGYHRTIRRHGDQVTGGAHVAIGGFNLWWVYAYEGGVNGPVRNLTEGRADSVRNAMRAADTYIHDAGFDVSACREVKP
jgi:hypothetical protein